MNIIIKWDPVLNWPEKVNVNTNKDIGNEWSKEQA